MNFQKSSSILETVFILAFFNILCILTTLFYQKIMLLILISTISFLLIIYIRYRVFNWIDVQKAVNVKFNSMYITSRQVEFDLKRDKRVYLEMNIGELTSKAIVRINQENKLEFKLKGRKEPYTMDFVDLDSAIYSLVAVCSDLGIIVVKEEYLKYLEENNCTGLLF